MRYYTPQTLEEALTVLKGEGRRVKVLAGGTDLVVQLKEHLISPWALVDVTRLDRLQYVREVGGFIRIGGLTTHAQLEASPLLRRRAPILAQAAATVGSPQIRNRGTIGGNLANASPAADTIPALFALDASLVLKSHARTRQVRIEDFFLAPGKTVLCPEELITEVRIAERRRRVGLYLKLGHRNALAISVAGVAVALSCRGLQATDVRIALGAVAPTVIRAKEAEAQVEKGSLRATTRREAGRLAAAATSPIADVRASAGYRRAMVRVLVEDALGRICRSEE